MARRPVLVHTLSSDLVEALRTVCDPVEIEDLDGVLGATQTIEPALVVLDARSPADGGHALGRIAERLADLEAEVLLIAPRECPEPVERVAAERGFELHLEPADGDIVDSLRSRFEVATEPAAAASSQLRRGAAHEPHAVLEGITRRFETNTLKLKRMLAELEVAAKHDVTILLIGETGSGKTFLSKLIHEVSPRRDEPFLNVACGALPRELIESELFGHVKGAFTSASDDKEGKFVAAKRGTVLLDEIDVLAPEQQVKLLRVIETGEFEPVGSNVTHRNQARLVVASNLDLQPLVEAGKFRPDLYYRLNMLKFEIPPLRERPEDVEPLVEKFVVELSAKHGVTIDRVDDEVLAALKAYPWPGNVRELENVVRRAVIYTTDGVVRAEHLPPHLLAGHVGPTNDPTVQLSGGRSGDGTLGNQVALTEKEIIEQALFKHEYSKTKTAKALGISRVTLYNKLKKYGLQ